MLFQDPSKEKKKKKVKTKKNRGDVVNREFEKYSSGSESNEDGDEVNFTRFISKSLMNTKIFANFKVNFIFIFIIFLF